MIFVVWRFCRVQNKPVKLSAHFAWRGERGEGRGEGKGEEKEGDRERREGGERRGREAREKVRERREGSGGRHGKF